MEQLSRSEEQVMAALWACSRAATRREIASHLPPECRWADSTLLNFLLRLEKKNFVRTEKQGNKNLYTPLVRRLTYCGAVSQAHLQTLYGGDIRAMVCALADTGRMTYADTERLLRPSIRPRTRSMTMSSSKPAPPQSVLRTASPAGEAKSGCISHISCQNRLGTWLIWAFSSRRCSMVNALKNRFHIRCQSSSVSSVPGI